MLHTYVGCNGHDACKSEGEQDLCKFEQCTDINQACIKTPTPSRMIEAGALIDQQI